MSQIDPICAPDYYFEERGMRHYEGMIPTPTHTLQEMNQRQMANYLMEARKMIPLSVVKEEQTVRSLKYDGLREPNDGNRRVKNPEYPWKPRRTPMRPVVEFEFGRL